MEWYIANKTVGDDGSQTIRYELSGSGYAVESSKRAGSFTTFYLIYPDGQEKRFFSLALAKNTAEAIARAGS